MDNNKLEILNISSSSSSTTSSCEQSNDIQDQYIINDSVSSI